MAYSSKHPKFEDVIFTDQGASSVANPAAGSHKLVDRNGIFKVKNSAGAESNISATDSYVTKTNTDYTILDNDGYTVIGFSTGSTDRVATLPDPTTNANRRIQILKVDTATGKVTIDAGTDTIEGVNALDIYKQYESLTVFSDGAAWLIQGSYTEYASNSSATDADVTASGFVAGPDGQAGVLGTTDLTDRRQKYVQWVMPIKDGDQIYLEFSPNQIQWYPAIGYTDLNVDAYAITALTTVSSTPTTTVSYGISVQPVSSTQTAAVWGKSANRQVAAAINWNSYTGTFWRMRKVTHG